MVINKKTPLTLAEVANLAGDSEREMKIKTFIKQFKPLTVEKAIKLKNELKGLDLIKLKDDHIVKLVDFMPEDVSDLNKVLVDVSFDQEEVAKILDTIKKN